MEGRIRPAGLAFATCGLETQVLYSFIIILKILIYAIHWLETDDNKIFSLNSKKII